MAVAVLAVALWVPTSVIACRLGGDHLPPGVTVGWLAAALMLSAYVLLTAVA